MAQETFDPALLDEQIDLGADAEAAERAFAGAAPVPDGKYLVKLGLSEREPLTFKKQRQEGDSPDKPTGPAYLSAALTATICEGGDYDGRVIFIRMTSLPNREGVRRLPALFLLAGCQIPPTSTLRDLKDLIEQFCSAEPTVYISTRWEAQLDKDHGYRTAVIAANGRTAKGMKNFPLLDPERPELGHQWVITDKETGVECTARAEMDRPYPKG